MASEKKLEREQRPQRVSVVLAAFGVLAEQPVDLVPVEPPAQMCAGPQHCRRIRRKVLTEPTVERYAEAVLASAEDLLGQEIGDGTFEDAFERKASNLDGRRQAGRELEQLHVEEWGANLESVRHAHPVRLDEQVVEQVRVEVKRE